MRRIIGGIIKCNEIFNMIKNHDRILVGISGGKDSTLLFYALSLYAQKLKEQKKWDVKVYAAHVKVNFWKPDFSKYQKWLNEHNLKINIIDSNISDVLNSKKKNDKIVCSLCSKMKKAILIREAKKLKCNK
ncbi:MAG: tRNA 2-thiocytidine biosynthesis protein TtcA, partial [Malacoplasma sp.]|nr:tRNA 2-thiocytidine biosynthesis protein TtcA [Malacoplasma sp.]